MITDAGILVICYEVVTYNTEVSIYVRDAESTCHKCQFRLSNQLKTPNQKDSAMG